MSQLQKKLCSQESVKSQAHLLVLLVLRVEYQVQVQVLVTGIAVSCRVTSHELRRDGQKTKARSNDTLDRINSRCRIIIY